MKIREFIDQIYWPEHALTLGKLAKLQLELSATRFSEHLGRAATIADFKKASVISFLAARRMKVSEATVNKDRRSLLCLWRCAADNDLADWPKRIPSCREPKRVPHTFTFEELKRLVAAAQLMPNPAWWRSLLLFLWDSSARISAALSVRLTDIDFDCRSVILRAESSKTLMAQVVSVADDTLAAIRANCLARDASQPVWPWRFHSRRLFIYFRKLAKYANVTLPRGKCFHSLRRSSASAIAHDPTLGVDVAQKQLGHSTQQVTMRYIGEQPGGLASLRICDHLPRP